MPTRMHCTAARLHCNQLACSRLLCRSDGELCGIRMYAVEMLEIFATLAKLPGYRKMLLGGGSVSTRLHYSE